MKLLTLAALAASLFGQDPTATVTTVNVETLKQLGIVTTPYSIDGDYAREGGKIGHAPHTAIATRRR